MNIDPTLSEWLNLILRWVHVFAGIMWVGTTYYFTWLDARLTEEEKAAVNTGNTAQVWMVHSGGFYVVERRKVPDLVSRTLHWFRWEAGTTWLSGMALLLVLFYIGGGSGLVDPDVRDAFIESLRSFPGTQTFLAAHYEGFAIVLGIVFIFLAGFIYDVLMRTPLRKNEKAFAVVGYLLLVTMALGLAHVLSARAVYIHIGAAMGTIMAANVWMHILPSQKKMIAALNRGQKPDENLSAQAKLRSKQNTFMAVPVVFLMISNHFPGVTYGERHAVGILALLILAGWLAAKFIRRA
ncbi:MAG TPA: urate hydroxylase PuuD [Pyrinomonadaceae bacterium]|nr:urate hydroxylase PuuD [Pyrinomonadaceae bacterium]